MAGGDFKLDFAAAAPWTYDHLTGGGSWDDKTIGRGLDVVESLQGGDFKSGQIVSYFLEIDVDTTAIEQNQAIQVKLGFLASTTGQSGVGQDWIQNIQVNYASERVNYTQTPPPAGSLGGLLNRRTVIDSANNATRNDGGSYAVLVEQGFERRDGTPLFSGNSGNSGDGASTVSTSFGPISSLSSVYASNYTDTSGSHWLYDEQMARLYTVFNVYDLDPGEKPVVRIDVHLGDDGQSPTGNLQGFLLDAQVISPTAGTTTINAGRQTIPFKLTKDITTDKNAGLSLEKFVTTDFTTFNSSANGGWTKAEADTFLAANRNKEATISAGQSVIYLYKVTNIGTTSLRDINLWDDAGINGVGLTYESFIPQSAGVSDANGNPLYFLPDGQTTTTDPALARKVLLGAGDPFAEDEIRLLEPKTGQAPNFNGVGTILYNGASDLGSGFGTGGTNDLTGSSYIIVAYQVQLSTVGTVDNEAVAASPVTSNKGGNNVTEYFGAVDTAKVNVLPTGGSIAGFVYHDLNNDGDKDAGEPGIAGATMTLNTGATVITDAQGFYRFAGLANGNYTITESQPGGFLDGGESLNNSILTLAQNDSVPNIAVSGALVSNYNFGEIRPASISGMAYYDLNTSLTRNANETGRSGVTITLRDSNNTVVATTTTDANGRYIFTGLRPGTYSVTGDGTENVGAGASTVGTSDGAGGASAVTNIVLAQGNTGVNYDFGTPPTLGSISGTVYEDPGNNGSFERTNSTDKPLQGVTLTLLNSANQVVATTKTDANGNYTFNNLSDVDETYRVIETQPQYFDGNLNKGEGGLVSYQTGIGEENDNVITVTLTPSNTKVTDQDFGEVPPASISGYVYVDIDPDGSGINLANKTFDPADLVLANVEIRLFQGSSTTPFATTTTDSAGYYQFSSLPAGTYRVVQVQPGGVTTDGEDLGVTQQAAGTAPNPFGVNSSNLDNEMTGIVLVNGDGGVEYNFRETATGAIIQGFVYSDTANFGVFNDNEAGISGVTVQLFASDGTTLLQTTTTDANGKYAFFGVPNPANTTTNYIVKEIQPTGYNDGQESIFNGSTTTASANSDQFIVGVVTTNTLYKDYQFGEIIQPGSLSGFVLYDADNNGAIGSTPEGGIGGVTISLYKGRNLVTTTTTANTTGFYQFTGLAPGDDYRVVQGEPIGFIDATTQPTVPGARINNASAGDEIAAITVNPGAATQNLNFHETKYASISGYVYDDNFGSLNDDFDPINNFKDKGIQGVTIKLTNAGADGKFLTADDTIATTTTNANGFYQFAQLIPSLYRIEEIDPAGYTSVKDIDAGTPNLIGNVRVAAEQAVTQQNFLDESPLGSISGFVFDDSFGTNSQTIDSGDKGIGGVKITLLWAGADGDFGTTIPADTVTTTTGADGSYTFANLLPGKYRLTEEDPTNYSSVTDVDDTQQNPTVNSIGDLTLAVGETKTGQNFLDVAVAQTNPSLPSVLLTKTVSTTGNNTIINAPNETLTYTITLQNTSGPGGPAIPNPVVTDPMLGGTLTNPVEGNPDGIAGTLDPGETWTFTRTLTNDPLVTNSPLSTLGAYSNALALREASLPDTVKVVLNPAFIPVQVFSNISGVTRDSYFDGFVSDPNPSAKTILNGWKNFWCVDVDRAAWTNALFTAEVYSTYDPTIPTDFNVDKPANLDLLNWVLNQDYIGTTKAGAGGIYQDSTGSSNITAGDVQRAIWTLVDDKVAALDLGVYDQDRVNFIVNEATTKGNNYVPGFGDTLAVLIIPLNSRGDFAGKQKVVLEVELPTDGVLTNVAQVSYTVGAETYTQIATAPATVDLPDSSTTRIFNNVTLNGDQYGNRLVTGDGADILNGLGGIDTLDGGAGADRLNGGLSRDTLTGGPGNDNFQFQFAQSLVASVDRITDFAIGADKIDILTSAGADAGLPSAFSRAADNFTATTLTEVVNSVFANAGTGSGLGTNSAALVSVVTPGASIAGTYLIINDGTLGSLNETSGIATFQSATDLVINITGPGTGASNLPAVGAITPIGDWFV